MTSDSAWLTEQLHQWALLTPQQLIKTLGTPILLPPSDPNLFVLVPHNPRLQRIVVRLVEGVVHVISLEGPPFALSFDFVQQLATRYERTVNTYDSVGEEQFFFYPAISGQPFSALEGWVPLVEQHCNPSAVHFTSLTLHFAEDLVPFHFRDGWHMVQRPEQIRARSIWSCFKRLLG